MFKLTGNGLEIFLQPISVRNYFFAFSIQKLVVLCFMFTDLKQKIHSLYFVVDPSTLKMAQHSKCLRPNRSKAKTLLM